MDTTAQAQKTQTPQVQKTPIPQPTQQYVANTPNQKKSKGKGLSLLLLALLLILLLILIVGASYYFFVNKAPSTTNKGVGSSLNTNDSVSQRRSKSHKISTTPIPTPTLAPLLQGEQNYKVGELSNGINISNIWFSTIDPGQGYQQIKVSLADTGHKVTSIAAEVRTNQLGNTYPLTLSSGDGSSGDWTGTWTLKGDTYNKNFQITLHIKDEANNTSSTVITIR